jgi:hypothetical protein
MEGVGCEKANWLPLMYTRDTLMMAVAINKRIKQDMKNIYTPASHVGHRQLVEELEIDRLL